MTPVYQHFSLFLLMLVSTLGFAADDQKVLSDRQASREKAEAEYKRALDSADEKAIKSLLGLARAAKDAEKIAIYKDILRIDSKQDEAVKYFTALGSLDQVLLTLNGDASGPVAKFVPPKTASQWKDLPGTEIHFDPRKGYIAPPALGLKPGMKLRIVPHPTESWAAPFTQDPNFATWPGCLVVRTGSGSDTNQFTKVSELPDMQYTVGEYDMELKCSHPDAKNLAGELRIKLLLIKDK